MSNNKVYYVMMKRNSSIIDQAVENIKTMGAKVPQVMSFEYDNFVNFGGGKI